jgi:hypothetical protein
MKRIAVALLLGALAFAANAQDASRKPSPEEMKQMMDTMMQSSMGAMIPMMGKMSEAMIEAQLNAAEKPDTARRIAQFKKNLYDELQKQGFSKSQAFSIMQNTSPPAASPSQK